jgi:hypothetical protein
MLCCIKYAGAGIGQNPSGENGSIGHYAKKVYKALGKSLYGEHGGYSVLYLKDPDILSKA